MGNPTNTSNQVQPKANGVAAAFSTPQVAPNGKVIQQNKLTNLSYADLRGRSRFQINSNSSTKDIGSINMSRGALLMRNSRNSMDIGSQVRS